ncbi:MAG: hypothetical protein LW875_04620 [Proteobacteria bacterium]|jgi:hypothetical protein|nr:hypothetical protein [Pseudomonadota bacterium]
MIRWTIFILIGLFLTNALASMDASLSEPLQLRDEYVELNPRQFRLRFGAKAQIFKPQGQGQVLGNTYELSEAGESLLPSLQFGALYDLGNLWKLTMDSSAGYSSQSLKIALPNSGSVDTRLNTTQIELLTGLQYKWRYAGNVGLKVHWGLGQQVMTQTSTESIAQWSMTSRYQIYRAGFVYHLNQNLEMGLDYSRQQRMESQSNQSLLLSPETYQLGAYVVW